MRQRSSLPKVVHHKPSGQAAVFLREQDGKRRMVYLGEFGSAAALERYRQVLSDVLAGRKVEGARASRRTSSEWPTVAQLCAAFLLHAESYYRDPEGNQTGEVVHVSIAFRPLLKIYRDVPVDRLHIDDLHAVRQAMIDARPAHAKGRRAEKGLSRRTINDRMRRVKALFRWGVTRRMVPPTTWHELSAMTGLPKGRCGVHDNPTVEPVSDGAVKATLPFLVPTFADLVRVLLYCGARPDEVLGLTGRQLDTSATTWLARPSRHKTAWKGKDRVIALGPKAVALLRPRLKLDPDALLFSGRDAWREHAEARRAARRTPETKQMRERDARSDEHAEAVAERIRVDELRTAVYRACDRAGVERWTPYQLRHNTATNVTQKLGIEHARAMLGHSDLEVTRRYSSSADVAIAAEAAARLG